MYGCKSPISESIHRPTSPNNPRVIGSFLYPWFSCIHYFFFPIYLNHLLQPRGFRLNYSNNPRRALSQPSLAGHFVYSTPPYIPERPSTSQNGPVHPRTSKNIPDRLRIFQNTPVHHDVQGSYCSTGGGSGSA